MLEGRSQAEVARAYGVSKGWVSKLVARYRVEGAAAFEPKSRRPKSTPAAISADTVATILELRQRLTSQGLDAGAHTIRWHLEQAGVTVSAATIWPTLRRGGVIVPEPRKRPRSSYIRFEAAMPNECWQSDFTHYRLSTGGNAEILTFLDDCTRYAIGVTAHSAVTTPAVLSSFRTAIHEHGPPASTLTDNGMVFTVKHSGWGRRGGRNAFEAELRDRGIHQKNGGPGHPQTQGKVERFQQTMKNWLRARAPQPTTIADLQQLLDEFVDEYNHRRPHRSLPHQATPATRYRTLPKAAPTDRDRASDHHTRVRHDRIDQSGTVTLRIRSRLHHIGIGRPHARTHVILLIDDYDVRIIHATTGELLRELTINPDRDYQPRTAENPRT